MENPLESAAQRNFGIRMCVYAVLILFTAVGMRADRTAAGSGSITTDGLSGVVIISRHEENMFPDYWDDPKAPTTATAPKQQYVPAAIAGIRRALRKYPVTFLRANLSKVYIVDNLQVDGVPSGGVNCPETHTIYVDLDNLAPNEVSAWAEETIHHEFAHLLADNHPNLFSADAWARLNSPGFHYGEGGTEAIRRGKDGDEISEKYLKQGFVEEYSMADADEDFATLCERLFSGDRTVRKAIDKYPILHNKVRAVVKFYNAMDRGFTEEYFSKVKPSTEH